jgi:hypothetical protein
VNSIGRRNTSRVVSCDGSKETQAGRSCVAGRPPVGRREHRERFWERIARGQSSEDAGVAASVSAAVGTRWFRESGGVSHVISPLSARYLSFVEREEIALCFAR